MKRFLTSALAIIFLFIFVSCTGLKAYEQYTNAKALIYAKSSIETQVCAVLTKELEEVSNACINYHVVYNTPSDIDLSMSLSDNTNDEEILIFYKGNKMYQSNNNMKFSVETPFSNVKSELLGFEIPVFTEDEISSQSIDKEDELRIIEFAINPSESTQEYFEKSAQYGLSFQGIDCSEISVGHIVYRMTVNKQGETLKEEVVYNINAETLAGPKTFVNTIVVLYEEINAANEILFPDELSSYSLIT